MRCVISTDAYKAINDKVEKYKGSIGNFEKISNSIDMDR